MSAKKPPESASRLADRKARLAEALRRNLKRRKDQARLREDAPADPSNKVHIRRPIG